MQNTARDELMGYLYILGTIFFTVYGQIVLKWRVGQAGVMPDELVAKLGYVLLSGTALYCRCCLFSQAAS
jgi:hypothetical protein